MSETPEEGEWPATGPRVEVTVAMIAAVNRAMHAVAPAESASDAKPFSRAAIDASTISSLRAQVACLDAENDELRDGKVPEAWRLDARRIECENTRLHDALKMRTDERDAAKAYGMDQCRQLVFVLAEARAERDAATERMKSWAESAGSWAAENAELRLELGRLHDLLAQRPAPTPDTPSPAHDFTRVKPDDRRRTGGFW